MRSWCTSDPVHSFQRNSQTPRISRQCWGVLTFTTFSPPRLSICNLQGDAFFVLHDWYSHNLLVCRQIARNVFSLLLFLPSSFFVLFVVSLSLFYFFVLSSNEALAAKIESGYNVHVCLHTDLIDCCEPIILLPSHFHSHLLAAVISVSDGAGGESSSTPYHLQLSSQPSTHGSLR